MHFQEYPHDGGSRLSNSNCCLWYFFSIIFYTFSLITWKKIESHRKKYIHIKLVIPSAVLKGRMQPNSRTASSVHAAFSQQHMLDEAAEQKEKSIVQLLPLVRKARWWKYKNTLFLKGASLSLFSDHACSTKNKLLPSLNKQNFFFFNWREKIQAQAPPSS